jgi:NDP-sugar pyrophosphorylase family protein
MKAVLLTAGLGTRLGALTATTPKSMLPINDRPLMEYIVELLCRHNFNDIAVNLHHKPDVILRHFGSGEAWGVRLRYSYEAALLGSAGTALRQLAWVYPDPFLVYYGDVYTDLNLTKLIEQHRNSGAAATLVVHPVDDPTRVGIVEFDAHRRVRRFVEKPRAEEVFSNWANSGIYVLNPEVLHYVTDLPSDFGHDIFPRLIDAGLHIQAHPYHGTLIDIGSPETYRAVQQLFAESATPSGRLNRIDVSAATA